MPEPTAADTKDLAPGGGDQPPLEEGGVFVLRPQSATAVKGKDINFVTKVDSSSMARKPAMKWLKGKWLDLGSKAGKHLQFKETYDRNTKIYTYEMKIIKVVDADAGSYRCEVTVKDKVDCSPFEITVEALQEEQEDNILESFKRSGEAGEDAGDLDFSALLKKRAKKKQQEPKEEVDVWTILKAAKPCDYEKIAFEYGITDLRGMLKMLKKMKKDTEPKQTDAFLRKLEPMYSVDKGKRIQMSVELADPDAHVKWFKNGQEINPSAKYVFESVGNKRTLTINKSNLSDDAEYECVVGEEKCAAQVFVKEPPVTITKLLDDVHTVAGEKVEFEVEVSAEGAHVKWMKDGVELNRDNAGSKYRFKKDGKRHVLVINEATTEDMGMYYAVTNGGESKAELEVEEKELEILQNIADLTLKAAEQAVFKCEVSDEKVTGKWFKDGVEVVASDRIKMSHIGRIHKLTIDDVKPHDAGDYTFVPDGYALSLSAKLNFIEIKIDYVPRQDPPKIHLDTGPGNKNTIIVVAGNKLRLDVEITGEPAPTVCWKRGDTEITEAEGRVRVETRDTLSSFVMDGAERADEGEYSIMVTNPAGEDKAEVYIKIVDVPDPPENVRCTSVGEDSAVITWDPPAFDGGVPLKGYLMERKKVGSARWTKLNFEVYETTTYEAKKMIEGVLYEMRVFAVNGIGVSQPSGNSKPFMPIAPTSEPIRLMVDDVTDSTCELKWRPPERLGAGGIDGYIIEYCKEGSDQWEQANSVPVEKTHYRVKGLPTGEKMLFRAFAVNIAGRSPPATLGQGVAIREIMEQPKIWLPRNLRTKLIKKVGEKINLVIPFQGKPRPVVTWLKEDVPLEDRAIGTRTSDVDTVLFIRSAERDHSGKYTLTVQIENVTARADIHIQIVEKPGPPINVHVTDVWGFNAALEWKPPKDDGNCDIIGYMIEKADLKTKEWFTVYEHNRRPNCTVSDLVMGNEYTFRVRSENICGLSDEVGISKNTANISKTGLEHKPLPFKEQDMCHSPKFTAPLVDRCVVAGYSAAISCSVRGFPKPKIIWMKNRMIIGEDPKFLMQNNQGVLTLNIRRPGLFDGGKYTCKAVNDLGEDEVECKLEVRVIQEKGEEQKSK